MSMNAIPGIRPAQLDVEETAVEGERLVERADLECDVIDPNRTSHGTQTIQRV